MDICGEQSERDAVEVGGRVHTFGSTYHLSPREHQILDLICRGHHPKAVASLVGCGYASVRTHLRRIYKKVGCSGVRELMVRLFLDLADVSASGRRQEARRRQPRPGDLGPVAHGQALSAANAKAVFAARVAV
jgi:DNA-binding CsgD family transcriptional regulator